MPCLSSQSRADVHWATSPFAHEKVRFQDINMTRNSEQQSERGGEEQM